MYIGQKKLQNMWHKLQILATMFIFLSLFHWNNLEYKCTNKVVVKRRKHYHLPGTPPLTSPSISPRRKAKRDCFADFNYCDAVSFHLYLCLLPLTENYLTLSTLLILQGSWLILTIRGWIDNRRAAASLQRHQISELFTFWSRLIDHRVYFVSGSAARVYCNWDIGGETE